MDQLCYGGIGPAVKDQLLLHDAVMSSHAKLFQTCLWNINEMGDYVLCNDDIWQLVEW